MLICSSSTDDITQSWVHLGVSPVCPPPYLALIVVGTRAARRTYYKAVFLRLINFFLSSSRSHFCRHVTSGALFDVISLCTGSEKTAHKRYNGVM